MFEKSNTFDALELAIQNDDLDSFKSVYESARFDINNYRAAGKIFAHRDVLSLMGTAMLQQRRPFVDYLMEKVPEKELSDVWGAYSEKVDVLFVSNVTKLRRKSLLYMAIENDMDDLSLRLIADKRINLGRGLQHEDRAADDGFCWADQEDTLAIAGRKGNKTIIQAIYGRKVSALKEELKDVDENGIFFRRFFMKRIQKELTKVEADRDQLLPPSGNPGNKPPAPKF